MAKRKRKTAKRRSGAAKALRSPAFRQRRIERKRKGLPVVELRDLDYLLLVV